MRPATPIEIENSFSVAPLAAYQVGENILQKEKKSMINSLSKILSDRERKKAEIKKCCELFINTVGNPNIADPDEASGGCEDISNFFLRDFPQLEGRLFYLLGYLTFRPRRHVYWHEHPNPDPGLWHTMIIFPGDMVLDLTSRQLDSEGSVYTIIPKEDVLKEWVSYSENVDDLF